MSESLIYVTCESTGEAQKVGKVLLEKKLVACVNLLEGMRSMYWWKGKVETGQEVVLIAKTKSSLVDEVTATIKQEHGYEVPCVVSVEITGGNPEFLAWIHEETA